MVVAQEREFQNTLQLRILETRKIALMREQVKNNENVHVHLILCMYLSGKCIVQYTSVQYTRTCTLYIHVHVHVHCIYMYMYMYIVCVHDRHLSIIKVGEKLFADCIVSYMYMHMYVCIYV